jgi:predicted kinase
MLTVVTGPPCSGKSTYAWSRAQPGDIVVDFDRIAQALGSGSPHDHPDAVRWVAIAARRAAVNSAIIQHQKGATVWLVHSRIPAKDMARYIDAGAEVVTLDVDQAELHARASKERPERWHRLIDEWKPIADPKPVRAPKLLDLNSRRGHWGRPWRRVRAQVLARSRVCWICGHDGSDSVDHLTPVSRGGAPLDPGNLAPAHHAPCPTCGRRCNTSRGVALGRGVTDGDGPPGMGTQGGGSRVVTADAPTPVSTHTW